MKATPGHFALISVFLPSLASIGGSTIGADPEERYYQSLVGGEIPTTLDKAMMPEARERWQVVGILFPDLITHATKVETLFNVLLFIKNHESSTIFNIQEHATEELFGSSNENE